MPRPLVRMLALRKSNEVLTLTGLMASFLYCLRLTVNFVLDDNFVLNADCSWHLGCMLETYKASFFASSIAETINV
jgi:hypothetical protein